VAIGKIWDTNGLGDCNLGGGAQVIGAQAEGIVQGQDLSIDLQALLVWLGNYGHLSYEKQQEFCGN